MGVPVVLAVILVTVGVVYCTSKGERLEYNNIIMFSLCSILYTPLNPDLQVETQGEKRGRSGPVCCVLSCQTACINLSYHCITACKLFIEQLCTLDCVFQRCYEYS